MESDLDEQVNMDFIARKIASSTSCTSTTSNLRSNTAKTTNVRRARESTDFGKLLPAMLEVGESSVLSETREQELGFVVTSVDLRRIAGDTVTRVDHTNLVQMLLPL
jgi:hypothetical protein